MNRITKVELRLLRDERWLRIDEPEASPRAMVEAYLDGGHVTCCSMQGGLFIDIDGRPWSDDGCVDEFRMTQIWFDALHALLGGASKYGPGFGPWEESHLTWIRDGDSVSMLNGASVRSGMMWPVTVDLPNLSLDVADRGRALARWTREVRSLLAAPLADPSTSEQASSVLRNLLNDRDLGVIDQLVAWVDPPDH